jgi:hypothetical protein
MTMPEFIARIRVTHPIEDVQVTAPGRNEAIQQLVEQATADGDTVEVMTVVELPAAGPTGTTGITGTTGTTGR